MDKDKQQDSVPNCKDCIYKDKHKADEKRIIESLKQLEGIKSTLLSIIK